MDWATESRDASWKGKESQWFSFPECEGFLFLFDYSRIHSDLGSSTLSLSLAEQA